LAVAPPFAELPFAELPAGLVIVKVILGALFAGDAAGETTPEARFGGSGLPVEVLLVAALFFELLLVEAWLGADEVGVLSADCPLPAACAPFACAALGVEAAAAASS